MKEVFLSYYHENKKIAADVKSELEKVGFSAFLAHEDIEVSKVWRDEIRRHLDSCSALIAIVTTSFSSSVWVNQEIGAVMAQGKPIVSLIFEGAEALPGFLEMFQGIPVSTISDAVGRSVNAIINSPDRSSVANTELAGILSKFINRWELYKQLPQNERWMPGNLGGPFDEILTITEQYAEELFELLSVNREVLDKGVLNSAQAVFSLMKKLSRSQILGAGTLGYVEMEKRGDDAHYSANALLNYLQRS